MSALTTTGTPPVSRTVLCAIDDGPHAAAVAYAAGGLARYLNAELTILRVDSRAAGSDADVREAEEELSEFVTLHVPGVVGYSESTHVVLKSGDPAPQILSLAHERHAGLIVMGSRARGRLGRAMLGSTAQEVIQETAVPVAIVPPTDPEIVTVSAKAAVPHFGTILVALDLAAAPDPQLRVTRRFAAAPQSRVMLLHVVPPDMDAAGPLMRLSGILQDVNGAFEARAVVQKGTVVDTIVRRAKHEHAGMVVLGRDQSAAGAIACDVLRQTGAVVVVVP
jgi:nucleotide-binding universal stress UspA family protein